jgi:hypothetical protein
MFTFCDSSWDNDHGTSRSTGGFLIFYRGGILEHSSNMSEPVAMISAEAKYKIDCMSYMETIHMHMTLNHIEELEDEFKEDKPVDIYMDNIPAVDTSITFKDTKNARHIRHIFNFAKQCVYNEWHTLVWIITQYIVTDSIADIFLAKKDLMHKIQYILTSIVRDYKKTDLEEGW